MLLRNNYKTNRARQQTTYYYWKSDEAQLQTKQDKNQKMRKYWKTIIQSKKMKQLI